MQIDRSIRAKRSAVGKFTRLRPPFKVSKLGADLPKKNMVVLTAVSLKVHDSLNGKKVLIQKGISCILQLT